MDVGTLVDEDELELLEVDEALEELLLVIELVELDELVLEVIDDVVLSLLITLVDEVTGSTVDVVVSSLDEITGSLVRLEVTLVAGPEQAEINKANKSDKCFFIIICIGLLMTH